ncbi:MAG: ATP-binding cassette domain-containing protein [Anaerolineae bacterium]|nr:ATP-binding cassette domain-containing protein [Anaerolineae bacterium]
MFIRLDDITIQANQKNSFEHTSWQIDKDQNWAIIGETGSGKSTLAKAIARKLPLQGGQIWYDFNDPDAPEGRPFLNAREILILSPETHSQFLQQYAAYHQARWHSFEADDIPTVSDLLNWQNIVRQSPFEVVKMVVDEEAYLQKRKEVIDLFKLDYLLDRKIIHVSHGESRKVFIARLLMHLPRLLILDDPYSGLDQESRERLASGIQALIARRDPPLLFVTSRLEDIPDGINYLMAVKDNRVLCCGDRETVLKNEAVKASFLVKDKPQKRFERSSVFDALLKTYSADYAEGALKGDVELIHMRDVCVTYGNVQVLKNINWTVKQGERWALLGHNGAGKTTLLSLILADNPKSYANDFYLFGQKRGSGESIWEIKQKIGVVSPELHIFYRKSISCLEAVCSGFFDSVGLYNQCSTEQTEIARRWLKAMNMQNHEQDPFYSLSTGQQRLTLLARALVKNPQLLVLDEPCQALDDEYRFFIIDLLDQICARTPISLLFVTHYRSEIPASITHQLNLDHGQAIYNGPRT